MRLETLKKVLEQKAISAAINDPKNRGLDTSEFKNKDLYGYSYFHKEITNAEIDKDIDLKIPHIKNIKKIINTESQEPEIFMALLLYRIIKKWGLYSLPLRVLHDLDSQLEIELNKYLLEESKND